MSEVGRTEERVMPAGSMGWQPAAIAEKVAVCGAYLELVATTPELLEVARRALYALALSAGQRVLEVGCGTGVFLPLLAAAVGMEGSVVGIDHSPDFVAQARERVAALGIAETVEVREGDAYRLPFPDGSFDAVHCERVLMHLDDPTAALREMHRVLRPGGHVVAVEPDWRAMQIDHPDFETMRLLMDRFAETFRNPAMGRELCRCFAEAGFVERRIAPVFFGATDIADIAKFGLDFSESEAALVASGHVTRERAQSALTYLVEASRDGTFFGFGGMFVESAQAQSDCAPL
ncbi:MAG: methyltransferase domain-containing protein [Chloroflexia bacterium]|nr:methyltransferase domain-containing protein [Chloroflexia bacterium]